jgi:hypothetical protein
MPKYVKCAIFFWKFINYFYILILFCILSTRHEHITNPGLDTKPSCCCILPWSSCISLLNPDDALRKSIIFHLLRSHSLCCIKSFLLWEAYRCSFSQFVTGSRHRNREVQGSSSWYSRCYSGNLRFEFRSIDRKPYTLFRIPSLIHRVKQ